MAVNKSENSTWKRKAQTSHLSVARFAAGWRSLATPMEAGAVWYLIHIDWWNKLQQYLESAPDEATAEQSWPGEVDNMPLVDTARLKDLTLYDGKTDDCRTSWEVPTLSTLSDDDFAAVPRQQWAFLMRHCGGGPGIARCVHEEFGQLSVEVHSKELHVGLLNKDKDLSDISSAGTTHDVCARSVYMSVSRSMSLSILRKEAALLLECDDEGSDNVLYEFFPPASFINVDHALAENPALKVGDDALNLMGDLIFCPATADAPTSSAPTAPQLPPPLRTAPVQSYGGTRSRTDGSQDSASPAPGRAAGLAGLQNLGNTCFMNSSLQCLSHAVPLLRCFLSGSYEDDINKDNPLGKGGEVARAFGRLVQLLWQGDVSSIAPRAFKATLGRHATQFRGYEQHDSQELLSYLLDMLHEDINRVKQKPYIEERDDADVADAELADEAWENYRARNDSFVVDHFQGLLKSTLDCPNCGFHKRKFDPFMYLSVPLPGSDCAVREFTLITVDGSRRPLQCSSSVPKHCTAQQFLVAAAATVGLSDAEAADSLLVLAVSTYTGIGIRVLAPDAEVPSFSKFSVEKLIVYKYASHSVGPLGGGRQTIVLPPKDVIGTIKPLPLLLFVPPDSLQLEPEDAGAAPIGALTVSSPRYVVRHGSALCDHVGDALRPFKRLRAETHAAEPCATMSGASEDSGGRGVLGSGTHTPCADEALRAGGTHDEPHQSVSDGAMGAMECDSGGEGGPGGEAGGEPDAETHDQRLLGGQCEPGRPLTTAHAIGRPAPVQPFALFGDSRPGCLEQAQRAEEGGTRRGVAGTNAADADLPPGGETQPRPPFRIVATDEYGGSALAAPGASNFFRLEVAGEATALFDMEAMTQPERHSSMSLQSKSTTCDLDSCIQSFLASEILSVSDSWFCPKCKSDVQARKALDLWRLPEVLVVHLKRFSYSGHGYYTTTSTKLDSLVTFPLTGLDMTRYVHPGNECSAVYDCFAVSNHFGSASGGHYTAYCCQPPTLDATTGAARQDWHTFDDSCVTPMSASNVVTPAAYVLFYRRRSSAQSDPHDIVGACRLEREARAAAQHAEDARQQTPADGLARQASTSMDTDSAGMPCSPLAGSPVTAPPSSPLLGPSLPLQGGSGADARGLNAPDTDWEMVQENQVQHGSHALSGVHSCGSIGDWQDVERDSRELVESADSGASSHGDSRGRGARKLPTQSDASLKVRDWLQDFPGGEH